MEDKLTITKNLNSIAVNAIFSFVLKTDPMQEAPGVHKKMLFKRSYKIFFKRSIAVIFKEYKHMENMAVLSGVDPESLTAEQKQKPLRAVILIKL